MPAEIVGKGLTVDGLEKLNRMFKLAPKTDRLALNKMLRGVAEPIASDAESLAMEKIRNMTVEWSRMRIGVSLRVVYVAPRERGTRKKTIHDRPNLASLLDQRAMSPALERNRHLIADRVDDAFVAIADRWNGLE